MSNRLFQFVLRHRPYHVAGLVDHDERRPELNAVARRGYAYHDDAAGPNLELLRDDPLRVVELDGTWLDFELVGKPYGTAMSLYVLHVARQSNAASGNQRED